MRGYIAMDSVPGTRPSPGLTPSNPKTPFRTCASSAAPFPPSIARNHQAVARILSYRCLKKAPPISDSSAGTLLRALVRSFGSVPFTLLDDPPPEPDYAFTLSQSLDRVADILLRNTGQSSPRR